MTVEAMRAAVIAIRAGIFDDLNDPDVVWRGQPSRAAGPVTASRPDASSIPWAAFDVGDPVVLVVAAHAGAGASTVALAVAEGLAEARRVQLVDYAGPLRSGLAAAPAIEMGADGDWRSGRRGRLDVVRLTRNPADGDLPPLPEIDDAARLAVVDAGWSLTRALLDSPGSLACGAMVVVTRVTVPGVRQTEQLLAAVDGEAAVAAVGPARWPRLVKVSCGPRLGELRSRGQMVPVPIDRRLQIAGLTGDRLPKPVAAAGRSLAALVAPAGETP
ncbi:hypothetical protein [Blastococcus saxobsidens]|uniref:MinD-like ATPase involved in chromosome partitioning or flagellar assembly n=1 Tax=Blastococcus saxobsidens (strain DD2) TaxID=1146883 RepID=H6RKK3_BLASD|nr:hypothetical protein [Blastococcus saxobsidens]CCG02422.1 conserved protein of unknown function; putative ATPase domain [Blastococcus saxobsidens DD2]